MRVFVTLFFLAQLGCVEDIRLQCEEAEDCDDRSSETQDECRFGVCHHTSVILSDAGMADGDASEEDASSPDSGMDVAIPEAGQDAAAEDSGADAPRVSDCRLTVVRHPDVPDRSPDYPLLENAQNHVVASFLVTPQCDLAIRSVVLRDNIEGPAVPGDYFDDIDVFRWDTQFLPQPAVDPERLEYLAPEPIIVRDGETIALMVTVDVLESPRAGLEEINGRAPFAIEIFGEDLEDGGLATGGTADLQRLYLARSGVMLVQLDPATPGPRQLVMGETDAPLLCVQFWVPHEDMHVCSLRFVLETDAHLGIVRNLRLRDAATGEQFGATATMVDPDGSFSFGNPDCRPDFSVRVGEHAALCVHADVMPYNLGGVQGAQFRIVLPRDIPDVPPRNVIAYGDESYHYVDGERLQYGAPGMDADIPSAYFTTYRTKLRVALAPGSPAGARSQASNQVVAIIRISNTPNIGNYDAMVQRVNLDIGTTLQVCDGARPMVRIYKDDISAANLLASRDYPPGEMAFDVIWADAEFPDFTIASGAFRDLFVTMDTNGFCGAPGSSRSLTVSLSDTPDAEAVRWNDGVSVITWTEGVPLAGNTLVYSF